MHVTRTLIIATGMIAASIWVGSLVCLALVAHSARRALDEASFVALFRDVGRRYRIVGSASLFVAMAAALAIAWPLSDVSGVGAVLLVLSGLLIATSVAGMVQARRMTIRRQRVLAAPEDRAAVTVVEHGAAVAGVLRGLIGVVTLAIVVLGANLVQR